LKAAFREPVIGPKCDALLQVSGFAVYHRPPDARS